MRPLNEAGVPAGVLLAPILPGITDSVESIDAVASAAADHGAAYFGSTALRLAPFVKEHYLDFIGRAFPHLLARYQLAYSGTNAPAEYQARLAARVARIRARYGFADDSMRRRSNRSATPPDAGRPLVQQLALPW